MPQAIIVLILQNYAVMYRTDKRKPPSDSEKALCAHSFMKFLVFQIKLKLMNKYKRMLTSTVVSWKKGSCCFVLIEPSKMNKQLCIFLIMVVQNYYN